MHLRQINVVSIQETVDHLNVFFGKNVYSGPLPL